MGKPKKTLKYNKKGTYPTYEFPPMAFGGWLDTLPKQYAGGGDLPPMEVNIGLPKYGKKRVLNLKDYTKQNTTSNRFPVVQNPFSRENKINLHLPENHGEEHRRLEGNPYFGGVNVEPDLNVYYGGVDADLNLLNKNNNILDLRGGLNTGFVTYPGGSEFTGVNPSVGLSYSHKFAEGGSLGDDPTKPYHAVTNPDGYKTTTEKRTLLNTASQFIPVYEQILDYKDVIDGVAEADLEKLNRGAIGMIAPFAGKALMNSFDYLSEKGIGKEKTDINAKKRNDIVNMGQGDKEQLFINYGHGGYDKWAAEGYPDLYNKNAKEIKSVKSINSIKKKNGGWLDEYSDGGSLTGPGKLLNRSRKEIIKQRELEENLRKEGFNEDGVFTRVLPEYTVKSPEKKLYDEAYNKSIAQQQAFQNSWYPGSTDSDNLGYAPGVMDNIKQRATVKANDFVAKNLVNNNKIGDLKDYQKDYIANSNYSGKLRPGIFQEFGEGVQDLGRITQGKLPTSKSLGILSPLEYPVNLVRGTIKGEGVDALKGNISSPWLDANDVDPGAVNDVGVYNTMTDLALDPLNLSGTGALLGRTGVKYLNKALKTSKESGVLSNASKINPWRFKENPEAYYRGLGKTGLDDALESRVLRSNRKGSFGDDLYLSSSFDEADYYAGNKLPWTITEDGTVVDDLIKGKGINTNKYFAEVPKQKVNVTPHHINNTQFISKDVIPIDKVKLLQQDWLKGYKEIPKNLPSKSNFTDGTSFIKDDITNIVKDINPLNWLKGNKRKELKKGTKWLDDWYNDPITINKIEGFKANRNSNKMKSNDLNDIANDIHYKTSPEHMYSNYIHPNKKWESNDIKRLRTPEKFNFSIKSQGQNDWDKINNYGKIIPGDITVNHLTPPSKLKSLQIHEGSHQITHNGGFFDKEQRTILQAPFKKNETELIPHMTDKFDRAYFANPTEVHARMNEIRAYLKVKPGEEVTLDMLNKAKNSKKWNEMFDHVQSLPKLKEAFKEIPALIPIGVGAGVGAGVLQQKKNGGWLDNL